jgi:spermidine/putrescine transport system permease protein
MTLLEDRAVAAPAAPAAKPRRRITGAGFLHGYTWLVIAWLILPVLIMIAFGFNATKGRYNQSWEGFTFKWYARVFELADLTQALVVSIGVAIVTMLVAGALGTGIAYALGRYRFRGSGSTNFLLFATMSAPELVMGTSLLSLFVSAGIGLGIVTITIAHIMFSISFVAVVVRARVLTLDPSMEEAASDLGASPWSTFWLITFPTILPAVASGMLLAFALSIDDFVVTNFTAGTVVTFPLWIWGSTRVGLPPQVNVMGTLIFAVGVVIAIVTSIRGRSSRRG